jgi:GNAT superfamily N-acetyltransferase
MISLTPETQRAYNATTGVIRAYRGRKIAQALKALAACYARQHGAREIGTDNDSLNAPMLAVNRKLGYQPQSGKYLLVSWLGPIDKPVLQVGRGVPRC